MTCPSCGGAIEIGGWPFCPDHKRGGSYNAQPDDWPGGKVFENLGDAEVTLYSRSELKRELKARGLVEMVRHVPGSIHTTSWASVDLEGAKALAERQAHTRATNSEPEPSAATVAAVKRAFEELRAR